MYKLITPPANLAISLTQAKAYLRRTVDTDDALITSIIKGAILQAQEYSYFQFVNAVWEKQFTAWPWHCNEPLGLILGKGYVSAITSIKYNDEDGVEQTWGSDNYTLDNYGLPNTVIFKADTLPTLNAKNPYIRVRYTAGFGADDTAVPEDIKNALGLMIVQMYNVRTDERPPLPKASERILSQYRYKMINV